MTESWLARTLELDVGAPGHGGFCVARCDGRVVFVRHALPGERVRAVVTEDAGASFCRADAIEVLTASPERVAPPCPHAGPGRCGGCDWQHAAGSAQRAMKAAVVCEQFRRVAGLDIDLDTVEELPGGLLGWRTRVVYAIDADGTLGLHRHRSHDIEPVLTCPLGRPEVAAAPLVALPSAAAPSAAAPSAAAPAAVPAATGIESACDDSGSIAVIAHRPGPGRQARGRRPPDRTEVISGPGRLRHLIGARWFEVSATGFWQVHPHALAAFAAALIEATAPQPGETVLDLYAGAGPLTAVLADAVGQTGRVVGIDSSRAAVADARRNLANVAQASVRHGRIDAALVHLLDVRPDVVVLDPPRAGAGTGTMAALLDLAPRCIGYLSCDPATLARDVRVAIDAGWRLASLRAFDAFPMTHHVECVASLVAPT